MKPPYSSRHPTRSLPHALKSLGSLSFVLRVTVINPFIGYPSQRERGLSRDPPSLFILTFFPHNGQQPPKQMKGFVSKLLSRRRHISLSRVAIGKRHKVAYHRRVRFRRDAKIQSEQCQKFCYKCCRSY